MGIYTTIRCKCTIVQRYRPLIAEIIEHPYKNIMFGDRVINRIMGRACRFKNYFYTGFDEICDFEWQEPISFKYDIKTGEWHFVKKINHVYEEEEVFFQLFATRYIEKIEFYESYSEFIFEDYDMGVDYKVHRVIDDKHKTITYNRNQIIDESEDDDFTFNNDTKVICNLTDELYWEYIKHMGDAELFEHLTTTDAEYMQYSEDEAGNMIIIDEDKYYLDVTKVCKEICGEVVVKKAMIELDIKEVFKFKRPLNAKDEQERERMLANAEEFELLAYVKEQIITRGIGGYFKNIVNYLLREKGIITAIEMIKKFTITFINNKEMVIK